MSDLYVNKDELKIITTSQQDQLQDDKNKTLQQDQQTLKQTQQQNVAKDPASQPAEQGQLDHEEKLDHTRDTVNQKMPEPLPEEIAERMRQAELIAQKGSYTQITGEKEKVNYKEHLFDADKFGGEGLVKELKRYYQEESDTLSVEEEKALLSSAPPAPEFEVLRKDEYNKRTCYQRYKYRGKVESYFKKRESYFKKKEKEGEATGFTTFAKRRALIDMRQDTSLKNIRGNTAAADEMDAAFINMRGEAGTALREKEIEAGKAECEKLKKESPDTHDAIFDYTYAGGYENLNAIARAGKDDKEKKISRVRNYMKAHPIDRELVVRRGVLDVYTLGFMMGLEDPKSMNPERIKRILQNRLKAGKETIVQEKGFVSTSLPWAKNHFSQSGNKENDGIEFIIKCKKGTAAMNIQSISASPDECELLMAPGTKFRVIDAKLDGNANIMFGNKKCWKIYLESIPVNEEGIKKEVA